LSQKQDHTHAQCEEIAKNAMAKASKLKGKEPQGSQKEKIVQAALECKSALDKCLETAKSQHQA
jgi:hypothetical protein